MTLHRAAAITLIGWYLMIPPLDKSNQPDFSVPLSSYMQASAYDTAAECESAKSNALENVSRSIKRKEKVDGLSVSMAAGLCVEADDPRLNQN